MRIGSIIGSHLRKLCKARFFILCDVMFSARLQGKLKIDHFWEGLNVQSRSFAFCRIIASIRVLLSVTENALSLVMWYSMHRCVLEMKRTGHLKSCVKTRRPCNSSYPGRSNFAVVSVVTSARLLSSLYFSKLIHFTVNHHLNYCAVKFD